MFGRQPLFWGASALVVGLTLGGAAAAQSSVASGAASPSQDADSEVAEVVVTGSLISRRDFQAESPISTISADAIKSTAAPSLDVVLGQMPQFSGAQGASEVGDAQGTLGFNGGQSYADLRGIGPNRSLVLMDGRRLMPSAPDGSIDLNTIPMLLIQNVEVITGGASATYGSDAIAGVTNFKLLDKFKGVEFDAQGGATTRGGGFTGQIGGIVGSSFAEDRGNFLFAFEYSRRDPVSGDTVPFFRNIRQSARPPEGVITAGDFPGHGAPTTAAVNSVLAGYAGTTPLTGGPLYTGAIGVNTDGTIFTQSDAPNCVQNYRGLGTVKGVNISLNCTRVQVALGRYFDVQVPLKKYNIFTKASYNLNNDVTAYAQFNYAESSAVDVTAPPSSKDAAPLIIPISSPYVTGNPGLTTILSSISPAPAADSTMVLTKLITSLGNRLQTFQYDVRQLLGGFKGDIPNSSVTYDVYASFGRSEFTNVAYHDISLTGVNSILAGTANAPGCTGFAWNPFGNHQISAACLAYAGRTDLAINTQTQDVVQGTIQGPLIHLWAREPLKYAIGADYRKTTFDFHPDSTFISGDSLAYGGETAAQGTQKVGEEFGEILIPLLSDKPFAEDLSIDAGYRSSKYDTFSRQGTWKIDGSWQPTSFMRLRGGYSVAIRAPSLEDLYGPVTSAALNVGFPPGAGDPCDVRNALRTGPHASQVAALCQAQGVPANLLSSFTYNSFSVQATNGSNRSLKPEEAHTWSVGGVITPNFSRPLFEKIQLSVDYYNIDITNAIGNLLLTSILPRCFNSDGVSNPTYSLNNPYCDRIQRGPSGVISSAEQGLFNYATYTLNGIDTQLDWRFPLQALGASPSAASLHLNSVMSYLKTYRVAGLLGSPTLNYAGSIGFGDVGGDISHPHWKANTSLTYDYSKFSATLRWRYIGAMEHSDRVADPTSTTAGVPAYNYFDVNAHYMVNDGITLSAGVNDIGNLTPPFVSGAPLTTDGATYDIVGRTWYLGVKAQF